MDPKLIRTVECRATAAQMHSATDAELSVVREAMEVGGPPLMTDGAPTVMQMTAWMAHEGVNRNRLAFVAAELQLAAKQVTKTSPLVMDFNHSAIHGWDGEQRCIGMWHSAEYAFDTKANDGAGAWGILVQGVMFAWLFPEIADALQAEQGRKGYIEFSMACIPASIEFAVATDGRGYEIAHNPVFFTNSALDVPPADPDAKGLGSEAAGEAVSEAQRQRMLSVAADNNAIAEDAMNEEMKALLAGLEETLAAKFESIMAADAAQRAGVASELEVKVAELETALAVANDATVTAMASTEGLALANEALVVERDELAARVAEYEAATAAAVAAATLEARLASLPERVREAHEARDAEKRARLENKWVAMSDTDWSVYLEDELGIATASAGTSYLDRSNRDIVPASGAQAQSLGERARRFIRK